MPADQCVQIIRIAAQLGFRKVRVTGGEPLLHPEIEKIVRGIASVSGIEDVSITTNGTLLANCVRDLKQAGLRRINISLDSLKRETYAQITLRAALSQVLEGIEAALQAGLHPVKINVVLLKGINEEEIPEFLAFAREYPVHVRFIECMPFLPTATDLFISTDVVKQKAREAGLPLIPIQENGSLDGPAELFRIPGAKGLVGLIHPMSHHFCSQCNRMRVTSDGSVRSCLLRDREVPLGNALLNPEQAYQAFRNALRLKEQSHFLNVPSQEKEVQIEQTSRVSLCVPHGRIPGNELLKKQMYAIGG